MTIASSAVHGLLSAVAERARAAGVFGAVRVEGGVVRCEALASAEPAEFRLFEEKGILWVSLVTSHRWLSQSIEADLVNTGDKIEELLEEELVDLGWKKEWGPARLTYQHFRDDAKMYTFRTPVPVRIERAGDAQSAEIAATLLLGYEQTFRPLGDMEGGEEE
jgi:hypothetical protein